MGRLCGTVPAGTQLKSSGNTMTVIFSTDSSVSNGGFTADYSSEEAAGEREELLFSDFFVLFWGPDFIGESLPFW